jgi:hypothetical protein
VHDSTPPVEVTPHFCCVRAIILNAPHREKAMANVSPWLLALIGPTGVVVGLFLQHFFARGRWLDERRWNVREKYYLELVSALTKWNFTLQDRSAYYIEPGSESRDAEIASSEDFRKLSQEGTEALRALRDLAGPAALFLSDKTIHALQQLRRDHWNVGYSSGCNDEYLTGAIKLADAQTAVLEEARRALRRA